MARILVADPIAKEGIERLSAAGHQVDVNTGQEPKPLREAIGAYDALVVRSATKVTADIIEAGERLQVIGRAGVGVDNIDLDAATRQGIPVVNAPTGNTIAAAEHAMALMLSLARNIPQAQASMKEGQWSPRNFMGVELRNKTLGIIGLGKIGSEVARRARSFQMRVLAHDPFVPLESARALGVELAEMDQLLSESDFLTIHTPLLAGSKQLLGAEQFKLVKRGIRIVNAARGGLVDETLLDEALTSGLVAGAALDVFASEPPKDLPLLSNPKLITTPHLGASTEEAQVEVAVELADQVLAVLTGKSAPYTVNAPYVPSEVQEALAPYIAVASFLGKTAIQLAIGQLETVAIRCSGSIARHDTSLLTAAAVAGVISRISNDRVNLLNANVAAKQRGLHVVEEEQTEGDDFKDMVTVEVRTNETTTTLSGTTLHNLVHLTRVNDFHFDLQPTGKYMMFTEHEDRPGMIGRVGTIAGEHDINISFMEVARSGPRSVATMVVGLDDPVPEKVLAEFLSIPHVKSIRIVDI